MEGEGGYESGPWPWLKVAGLDNAPLELVWFDDRRGAILDRQAVTPVNSEIEVELPDMDPDTTGRQFFKSVAFLIQPAGFTPERDFAVLPNEPIGQILVDTSTAGDPVELPDGWHEESVEIFDNLSYRYVVKTKPKIDDPYSCYYVWDIAGQTISGYGEDDVSRTVTATGWQKVSVDIYKTAECNDDERISGDIIFVNVKEQ